MLSVFQYPELYKAIEKLNNYVEQKSPLASSEADLATRKEKYYAELATFSRIYNRSNFLRTIAQIPKKHDVQTDSKIVELTEFFGDSEVTDTDVVKFMLKLEMLKRELTGLNLFEAEGSCNLFDSFKEVWKLLKKSSN